MAAHQPDPASQLENCLQAQQAERQRIAQLLHNTVSQSLTGTYLQAMVVAQKMQKNGSEDVADVARLAEMLHQVALEMHEVTRQLTLGEQPASDSDRTA